MKGKFYPKFLLESNREAHREAAESQFGEIVEAGKWISSSSFFDTTRGFRNETFLDFLYHKTIAILLQSLENILDRKLWIRTFARDLTGIDPNLLCMVRELKNRKIISFAKRFSLRPDWPKAPCYSFNLNPVTGKDGNIRSITGAFAGTSKYSNDALRAAIAELLERHALISWDHKKILRSNYKKFPHAVNPLIFKRFSDKQLENESIRKKHFFSEETEFDWIEAVSLLSGKTTLIPAQLAYIHYRKNEPVIGGTTTSGAGAGDTHERAAYAAICENIERDAFMVFWLNMIAPPKIDQSTIKNDNTLQLLREYTYHNIEIYIFDITTDIDVPTILVLSIDRTGGGPAVHVTAAADLDPEQALYHALLENVKVGTLVMPKMDEDSIRQTNEMYPNFHISERGIWWSQPENIEKIAWMLEGKTIPLQKSKTAAKTYKEKLAYLKKLLERAEQETFLVDVSTPVADEFGLTVIMSIIPGLYPMYLREEFRYLGVKRLYDLPVKLGYLKKSRKEEEMNSTPHPFM